MSRKDNIYVLLSLMSLILMCIYIYRMPSYQFEDAKEYEEQMRLESEHESIANLEKNETLTVFEPYMAIKAIEGIKDDNVENEQSNNNEVEETQEIIEEIKDTEKLTEEQQYDDSISTIKSITDEEFYKICRVVMNEAGGECYQMQVAVAETIINRVNSDKFPDTIYDVLYQPYQYSHSNNGEITDSVKKAVEQVLEWHTYDTDMVYFREDYYHEFGEDYFEIDNMYFSKIKE